jgi:Ca2+/H+ antiporter, TMEM165/GDT1 family
MMNALLLGLVTVLLAEWGGRMQRQSEVLCAHFQNPAPILSALAIASTASLLVAAIGGVLIAPVMPHDARTLLLGLALLVAGTTNLFPTKKIVEPKGENAFVESVWRFGILQFGDNSQFLVFAISAFTGAATLALVGGLIGVLVSALPTLLMAGSWRRSVPVMPLRYLAIGVLIVSGAATALSALRLI